MTVSTSYAPLSFNGDDATTAFAVTWPFFDGTLVVTLIASDGTETVKTITTHYTVSGGTDADGLPATGSVTMLTAPASGETLRITRNTSKVQSSSWTNGGPYQAKTLEATLDKIILIAQEQQASINDDITGDIMMLNTSGATDYWDAESQIIRNVADAAASTDAVNYGQFQQAVIDAGSGDVVGPASATDNNVATFDGSTGKIIQDGGFAVSSFMQTVLDDSTSIAAKTTLGIDVVNAGDYVAGDGVTDDTSALASAFTAAHGKVLYVPAGLTILTGNISLSNSSPTNIPAHVIAHGATFKAKSGLTTSSYLLTLENVHGSSPGFRWEGGTFDCNDVCRGVYIHGMQRGYVGHIRVISSYAFGVDVVGESGYGVYYNLFENWRVGESGSENGSTGVNDYANGSAYYNGANTFLNCTVQFNKGHGFSIDYSQNNYIGCSIEKNDLYGYAFNNTHATTIVGGYSENNHLNFATDGVSDGGTDYSFNFTASNTTGVKIYGGRHAAASGTLTGQGNIIDLSYPGNGGLFFDGTTFAANGQYKFPATQNASSDVNTLDDYEEGTWTPAITFGGGSTGLTYSAREGTYTKIGRHIFGRGSIQMSAKGSSTGAARMTGFPFTSATGKTAAVVIDFYSGMTSFTAGNAEIQGGSASANFYIPGATASSAATEANFSDTSSMWFTFHYHV
jgi:hypothetical protein